MDIEEGKPPLKLPYNISEDPYMAAHNFLEKHELSQLFLDQVAKFIIDQCQGIELGTGSRPEISDPFTGIQTTSGFCVDISVHQRNAAVFP